METKTYKRKLILTKAQEKRISSWIGACRVVYNMSLEIRMASWRSCQKSIHKYALSRQLKDLKHIGWIKDVPCESLENAIFRLDDSYKSFFKGAGFPKFMSKKDSKSILIKATLKVEANRIKLSKLGWLKMFKDSPIVGIPKIVTIIKEPTGYFACIVCDEISKTI